MEPYQEMLLEKILALIANEAKLTRSYSQLAKRIPSLIGIQIADKKHDIPKQAITRTEDLSKSASGPIPTPDETIEKQVGNQLIQFPQDDVK